MDDDDIVLPEPVPTTSLAVALAPIGAVLRFHLSKLNGALTDDFPLGTFAVRNLPRGLFGRATDCIVTIVLLGGVRRPTCLAAFLRLSLPSSWQAVRTQPHPLHLPKLTFDEAAACWPGGLSAATIAILSACLTGITGSLSTVSTFVNEIDGLGAQVDELVLHGRQVGCP